MFDLGPVVMAYALITLGGYALMPILLLVVTGALGLIGTLVSLMERRDWR